MTIKKLHLFLIISLFLGFACTVQKRHYSKGYQITFKSVKKNNDPKDIIAHSKTLQTKPLTNELIETKLQNDYSNKLDSKKTVINLLAKSTKKQSLENDSCDVLHLRNGKTVKIKVIEINEKEIIYKRVDNLNGPLIFIEKNDVEKIVYKNGVTEEFKFEKKLEDSKKTKQPVSQEYDGFGIASFVFSLPPFLGIISFFNPAFLPANFIFFAILCIALAITLGVISLIRIKHSNGSLKGKLFAIAGIAISLSLILLSILFIILFFLLFI
jgi:hypothetical protein